MTCYAVTMGSAHGSPTILNFNIKPCSAELEEFTWKGLPPPVERGGALDCHGLERDAAPVIPDDVVNVFVLLRNRDIIRIYAP